MKSCELFETWQWGIAVLDVYCPTHESCISLEGLDAELSGPEQSRAIWKRGCQGPCSATCTCSPPCSSPCSWAAVRCLAKPPPRIEWVRKLLYKREWADQHLAAGHGGQEEEGKITKAKLRVWLIDPSFWWMSSGLSRITKRVSVRKFAANSFSFGHTSILCAVCPPLSPSVAIFVYVNTSDVTILPSPVWWTSCKILCGHCPSDIRVRFERLLTSHNACLTKYWCKYI